MNIFYGGAFNPPTKAHIDIIRKISMNPDDKVVVGITDHDYKQTNYTYEQRIEMMRIAMQCHARRMTEITLVRQYARTWRFLASCDTIPKIDAIVVGEDEWNDIRERKWQYSSTLLENYNFIVIPRKDFISSTSVRDFIAQGRSYDEQIACYIDEPVYELAVRYMKS